MSFRWWFVQWEGCSNWIWGTQCQFRCPRSLHQPQLRRPCQTKDGNKQCKMNSMHCKRRYVGSNWKATKLDQNTINCKWLFRVKEKENGEADCLKSMLVAIGMRQREGMDYSHETFSLVIKPMSIRLVLSIAHSRGWKLNHINISNAFLYGHLQEDIYDATSWIFQQQTPKTCLYANLRNHCMVSNSHHKCGFIV